MGGALSSSLQKLSLPKVASGNVAENIQIEPPFPTAGIRVSHINEFLTKCGGRDVLEGLSTTDVCNKFIISSTLEMKTSYCEMISSANEGNTLQATVFISHPWELKFLDVIDAIINYFKLSPDTIIWMDIFSRNQHTVASENSIWYSSSFKHTFDSTFKECLLIFNSVSSKPVILGRTWCLWELFCAASTPSSSCSLNILMTTSNQNKLIDIFKTDLDDWNQMLNSINIELSDSSKSVDKLELLNSICSYGGVTGVNTICTQALYRWCLAIIEKELNLVKEREKDMKKDNEKEKEKESTTGCDTGNTALPSASSPSISRSSDTIESRLQLSLSYGRLLTLLGRHKQAETVLVELFNERREREKDLMDIRTLDCMHYLAEVYGTSGQLDKLETVSKQCLVKKRVLLGDSHLSTLSTMALVAQMLEGKRKFKDAESLYSECLERQREMLGDSHVETLRSMNNLATTYHVQGKYEKAESLYRTCLEREREKLGEAHEDTLRSMSNLAGVLVDQEKYAEAESLYRVCYESEKERVGENHPSTFKLKTQLIQVYNKQEKFDEANKL
mmetsp:Transcript_40515/g.41344  ORF Transcript_40515/g.41344 Transcript_40515/m.41344 type:complete len:561 (+) Transcript_40515:175-1857(+)